MCLSFANYGPNLVIIMKDSRSLGAATQSASWENQDPNGAALQPNAHFGIVLCTPYATDLWHDIYLRVGWL